MRVVEQSGDDAGRLAGDRKPGTAGRPQNGDGLYRVGVWALLRQERFYRFCPERAHSGREAALVTVTAPIIA